MIHAISVFSDFNFPMDIYGNLVVNLVCWINGTVGTNSNLHWRSSWLSRMSPWRRRSVWGWLPGWRALGEAKDFLSVIAQEIALLSDANVLKPVLNVIVGVITKDLVQIKIKMTNFGGLTYKKIPKLSGNKLNSIKVTAKLGLILYPLPSTPSSSNLSREQVSGVNVQRGLCLYLCFVRFLS